MNSVDESTAFRIDSKTVYHSECWKTAKDALAKKLHTCSHCGKVEELGCKRVLGTNFCWETDCQKAAGAWTTNNQSHEAEIRKVDAYVLKSRDL